MEKPIARIHIDRSLPVPLAIQLQGQIEYGVSYGTFPPESQLPSVRELADTLGVSPVTISQVYKALQKKELIVTYPGKGTFVQTADRLEHTSRPHAEHIDILMQRLIHDARTFGLDPGHLTQLLHTRLSQFVETAPVVICLVGIFPQVTRSYAKHLGKQLVSVDKIDTVVFDDLYQTPEQREVVHSADLVLTFAHRLKELRDLIGTTPPIKPIGLIPSRQTRIALADLEPLERVGAVSAVPEFLPTLKQAVQRFAPHLQDVRGALTDSPEALVLAQSSDVIVYGTSSDAFVETLPHHVKTFEYRHVPDPIHFQQTLSPLIEEIRRAKHSRLGEQENA
jgi:DNA-binding transcriptional regulator YhcF (GntR family)